MAGLSNAPALCFFLKGLWSVHRHAQSKWVGGICMKPQSHLSIDSNQYLFYGIFCGFVRFCHFHLGVIAYTYHCCRKLTAFL